MDIDGDFSDMDKMIDFLESNMRPGITEVVDEIMKDGADRARQAPFQDHRGALRASIVGGAVPSTLKDSDNGSAIEGRIAAEDEAASFVEYDTKAHKIVPRGRRDKGQAGARTRRGQRMLRFEVGGDTVFAREVNHPGTKGMHFIEQSMTEGEFMLRVAAGADKIIGKGGQSG